MSLRTLKFAIAFLLVSCLFAGVAFSQSTAKLPGTTTEMPVAKPQIAAPPSAVATPVYGTIPVAPAPAAADDKDKPAAPIPMGGTEPGTEILIGGGDLLEVSVYGAPDFSKVEVRVSTDGIITLPMIGQVKVGGLKFREAEALVAKKLNDGGFFNEPQVSIFAKEYGTQGISVLGEVAKPGIYPLLGPRRLFDAISAAGGTTTVAGQTVTITHRGHQDTPETVKLSYAANGSPQSNVIVYPGDTVVVSRAGVVYVVGDVHLPSGIVMQQPRLTVLQALAMAQGANSTAKLSEAKLIRRGPDGPQESPLDLKKILAAKAPDPVLEAEDIVFVPSSTGKKALGRSLEAIISTASGLAIYHRP
jgi:polysaccharide biosynthesis/export protein